MRTLGILLMAYGTPRNMDELEAYYTHIRHGRPPTPELLENLRQRYESIGGVSPLNEITTAQARELERMLESDPRLDRPVKVILGMKHSHPFIEEAVETMTNEGIDEAITLVLAPHYSSMSVGAYQKTAEEAAARSGGIKLHHVRSWHLQPTFLSCLADRVRQAITTFTEPDRVEVLFTAHSLPTKILDTGDPYPKQLQETAQAVAQMAGVTNHRQAWQSAGRTSDPWLGPDILEVLQTLHNDHVSQVLVCPIGFVSDHLEVLYDIDIEAQQIAQGLDMTLKRTASLNADPQFIQALGEIVRQKYVER